MTIYLPSIDWSKRTASGGVTESGTLNESATSAEDRQLTVAAEHAFIRTIYGEDRVGAQIANVLVDASGSWVIQAVWGEGEIDSINDVLFNDEAMPVGVTAYHYTGTAGQTTNSQLVAAFAAQSPSVTYADALPGIAYTVFVISPSAVDGFPQITARVKGLKIYDTRTTLTAYNENPAQVLRDFIVRATGRSVIASTVTAVANDNDELVSGVKRRTIGLTMDSSQDVSSWIDTLCTYASCWCVMQGASVALVSDRPRATDFTLDHSAGQILSLKVKKRGIRSVPTCVRVRYTNTTENPWRDDWEEYDSGAYPRRESEIALPGYHSAAQAKREGIERYNKQNLNDLSAEVEVFDEGLRAEVGDVCEITHPIGFVSKKFRVLGVSGELGRYKLSLIEYDPAAYSDTATATPTYSDTNNVSALHPPAPTNLVLTEEPFLTLDGSWSSRVVATWDQPAAAYLTSFRVEVFDGADPVYATSTTLTETRTPALKEARTYSFRVATVSSIGAVSDWATQDKIIEGKQMLPSPVGSLSGSEYGGEVRLTVGASFDVDMQGYEIRYGPVGCSWDLSSTVKFADFINAASGVGGYCIYKDAPVGTWDFMACALDSVGQYSATPARLTLTVTRDVNSFLLGNHDYTSPPAPTGMKEYSIPGDPTRYFITEDNASALSKFGASAMTSFPNAIGTYHASQTSQFVTEAWDVGVTVAGNWAGEISSSVLNGTKIDSILLAQTTGGYVDQGSLNVKTGGRSAKLQSIATGTSTLLVTLPKLNIRIDAIPRVENGLVTTDTNGYARIILANPYTAAKSISLTPQGSSALTATFDNIQLAASWARNKDVLLTTAGSEVIVFDSTIPSSASGNCYDYTDFYQTAYPPSSYTTQAGDVLEFDYCVLEDPNGVGSPSILLYNGVWGSGTHLAQPFLNTVAVGQWGSRAVSVTSGYAVTHCALVFEADLIGRYRVALKNVRITNGSGTVRRILWQEGKPVTSSWLLGQYQNRQQNFANTFDLYTFSGATLAPSKTVQWAFEGV